MKKILMLVPLIFSSLLGMLRVDPNYVVMPRGYEQRNLFIANSGGFYIDIEGDLYPIHDQYLEPELRGKTLGEVFILLGKLWLVSFGDRRFMVSRINHDIGEILRALYPRLIPADIEAEIERVKPPLKKLELYFIPGDHLGIRLIDSDEEA